MTKQKYIGILEAEGVGLQTKSVCPGKAVEKGLSLEMRLCVTCYHRKKRTDRIQTCLSR